MTNHYDDKYYTWQKSIGEIGGILNKFKFEEEVDENEVLMDFGCGGGFLLQQFSNKTKIGFEINKSAWEDIKEKNIQPVDTFEDLQDNSIGIIISNHALEHVQDPFQTLKKLYTKLKIGGKIILVVPCEQPNDQTFYYKKHDINQHLFTWCPMTLGNLFNLAGFEVRSSIGIQHQWCSDFKENYNAPDFHKRCIENAKKNGNIQIKIIAEKLS